MPIDVLILTGLFDELAVVLALGDGGKGAPGALALSRTLVRWARRAARRGQVRAVLVSRFDRFGRSAPYLLANIRSLRDAGVEFIAVERGTRAPEGRRVPQLLLTVLSGVAELSAWPSAIASSRSSVAQEHVANASAAPRADGPSPAEVRKLRRAGKSWNQIAEALDCSSMMARRAEERA